MSLILDGEMGSERSSDLPKVIQLVSKRIQTLIQLKLSSTILGLLQVSIGLLGQTSHRIDANQQMRLQLALISCFTLAVESSLTGEWNGFVVLGVLYPRFVQIWALYRFSQRRTQAHNLITDLMHRLSSLTSACLLSLPQDLDPGFHLACPHFGEPDLPQGVPGTTAAASRSLL